MNADVVGFTRMMSEDDVRTLETLADSMERMCELIATFGGRVVDRPGDNLLAEFPSETDALSCAMQIQRTLERCNRARARAQQMLFRIGLHCGELLSHGGRIYGDVVNLASRLQAASAPSELAVSEAVAERVAPQLARRLVDRGDRHYKNIPYRVRTLCMLPTD